MTMQMTPTTDHDASHMNIGCEEWKHFAQEVATISDELNKKRNVIKVLVPEYISQEKANGSQKETFVY